MMRFIFCFLLSIFCFSAQALPPGLISVQPISGGLVAWWSMNQISGATFGTDLSGYGHFLTPYNLAGGSPPSFAQYFTNSGQHLQCSIYSRSYYSFSSFSGLPTGANPCTLAFWIYPIYDGGYPAIPFAYGASGYAATRFLYISNSGGSAITISDSTLPNPITVQDNVWSHVVLSNDGSYTTFFINGVWTSKITCVPNPSNPVTFGAIGAAYDVTGFAFRGFLFDFRVYNRTLSTNEVLQLYNQYN